MVEPSQTVGASLSVQNPSNSECSTGVARGVQEPEGTKDLIQLPSLAGAAAQAGNCISPGNCNRFVSPRNQNIAVTPAV